MTDLPEGRVREIVRDLIDAEMVRLEPEVARLEKAALQLEPMVSALDVRSIVREEMARSPDSDDLAELLLWFRIQRSFGKMIPPVTHEKFMTEGGAQLEKMRAAKSPAQPGQADA